MSSTTCLYVASNNEVYFSGFCSRASVKLVPSVNLYKFKTSKGVVSSPFNSSSVTTVESGTMYEITVLSVVSSVSISLTSSEVKPSALDITLTGTRGVTRVNSPFF